MPRIQGGENHVEEYQNTLKNKDALTAELRKDKMSDQWIETYFLSVRDGITINQSFVDAVKCRQARAQAKGSQPTNQRRIRRSENYRGCRSPVIMLHRGASAATNYLFARSLGKIT